jgi:hypothetical protein
MPAGVFILHALAGFELQVAGVPPMRFPAKRTSGIIFFENLM